MTQRFLKYTVRATDTQATSFINLAKDLSAVNRQLFRQARMYKVKSITVVDNDEEKFLQFGCAPDTWAMRNAMKRAYSRYNEMNNQVLDDQPSLKSKWSDFKPYLSLKHNSAESNPGTYNMESPEDIESNNVEYGEWNYSTFESPDGTSSVDGYEVGLLGGHSGSPGAYNYVGLIQSYGDTRGTVGRFEPSVDTALASDDPLLNLLDAGTQFDEIAENLIGENNSPPYKVQSPGSAQGEFYVGAETNMPAPLMFAEFNPAVGHGLQKVYNINVPLGVIRLDHKTERDTTDFTVIIEMAEGSYKGIHSESLV
ncbi:MAG TPA: hypothetical protein HA328_07660 [Candidatus Poseidoniaceae archaeon]|mgnify:CR=1 FL=1|nr:hypothetical protein [Candidatus Poseidoniaceae archaeon]